MSDDILVFYVTEDTLNKRDATGAFIPEAQAFMVRHGGQGIPLTWKTITNRKIVFETLAQRERDSVRTVVFFGHGTSDSVQLGFLDDTIGDLAQALAGCCTKDVNVCLYACSVADGPEPGTGTNDGIADRLRDELCARGLVNCRVLGHRTAGHTTHNPYMVEFLGMGSEFGGDGGEELVSPGTELWEPWKTALRGDLRFDLPFLTKADIVSRLGTNTTNTVAPLLALVALLGLAVLFAAR